MEAHPVESHKERAIIDKKSEWEVQQAKQRLQISESGDGNDVAGDIKFERDFSKSKHVSFLDSLQDKLGMLFQRGKRLLGEQFSNGIYRRFYSLECDVLHFYPGLKKSPLSTTD